MRFEPSTVLAIIGVLIGAKWVTQLALEYLNRRNVVAHSSAVPDAFKGVMDEPTYGKSVHYTLAKSRLEQIELTWSAIVLLVVLFSGVLPPSLEFTTNKIGSSAAAMAAWLFLVGMVLSLADVPFDLWRQFRLEQRFGFNTTTLRLWLVDRAKGFLLALVLGFPLLWLILKLVEWTGSHWWIWAWASLLGFQLLVTLLAPVLILPLFNKFTPLPEGTLKERLLALAGRVQFVARGIQVMDGSRRSRHSNAFFIGFGRFRKIVLYDTLVQQLTEPELEAVLAHEIGHYKKKHIPKTLVFSALGSLAGFYVIAWLARQAWFYQAFGFDPGSIVPALLLFSLLSGTITFWISPLAYWWSRKNEYQADAYAAEVLREAGSLIAALRKLTEKNLSNLTPHPVYSSFYYSHPTLLEREQAMRRSTP